MKKNNKVLILPGDGIGVEVMNEVIKIISHLKIKKDIDWQWLIHPIGGACYDKYGEPITNKIMDLATSSAAILFGAVGSPKYDHLPRDKRPEIALLKLRKDLDLFANIRPAKIFKPLINASSLKKDVIDDMDIVIIRELTAGVYFGTPRGEQTLPDGTKRVIDTQSYTQQEIIRIGRVGFETAQKRKKKLHSVDKANVMETGAFWRSTIAKLHEEYPDIELQNMYADNCAMQLIKNPKQFDVIVTDNLFGDILSDAAAMASGSLGMLPSASLGVKRDDGSTPSMYEPIHGSAPDIANKNLANPLAAILSLAMCCRYSFQNEPLAKKIENAVEKVLANGIRTNDIKDATTKHIASTSQVGAAVISNL
ncbi:MAG: 3-isopropylmalate dehydrogenase [Alphaproteobacteria bacterium]